MDKIWYRNPSKSEVIGRCGGDEKTQWQKSNAKKNKNLNIYNNMILSGLIFQQDMCNIQYKYSMCKSVYIYIYLCRNNLCKFTRLWMKAVKMMYMTVYGVMLLIGLSLCIWKVLWTDPVCLWLIYKLFNLHHINCQSV